MSKKKIINKVHKQFPNIYFAGTQKAGTSTLHWWLKQDKRFSLPRIKETHFFSSRYHYGAKWYLNQFDKKKFIIKCEIDPSYMFCKDAFKRISENIVEPKFIFILRHPIHRAYSQYLMSKYRG